MLTLEDIETTVAGSEEYFTREDRVALIRQGVMVEQMSKELHDLKVVVRESSLELKLTKGDVNDVSDHEKRLRLLEEANVKLNTVSDHENRLRLLEEANVKFTTQFKTIMWIGGAIITVIQAVVEVVIHVQFGK